MSGVPDFVAAGERFDIEHEATYGHRLPIHHPKQIVALRVTARVLPAVPPRLDAAKMLAASPARAISHRPVYFGAADFVDTDVIGRADLSGEPRHGPLVIRSMRAPPWCRRTVEPISIGMATLLSISDSDPMNDPMKVDASGMLKNSVDSLTLEIIRNGFSTIADEMALILMRSAHSMIVRDSMDYSTAICDTEGRIVGQGLTTPMHLGSFYDAMRHLLDQFDGCIRPGDLYIANDPYLASGQHLPDIYIIAPIFHEERLEGFATTIAHHVDVGGIIAGSNSIGATEIFQEGLRLPFLKLHDAGVENSAILDIVAPTCGCRRR